MSIVDTLGYTPAAQASGESFTTLETASYGQVLRGVALVTPSVPEPHVWAMLIAGFFGLGAMPRRGRAITARGSSLPTSEVPGR